MGTGFLEVVTSTANGAMPVPSAKITVFNGDNILYEMVTNESGVSSIVPLGAPAVELTLDPSYNGIPYSICDVKAEAEGYATAIVHGVEILDTETTILPIDMHPLLEEGQVNEYDTPPHNLVSNEIRRQEGPPPGYVPPSSRVLSEVIIPEFITVHLGRPDNPNARNVRVPFVYYIKNCASHEIFSTWPAASLEANIYCIISFTLNRIFTNSHRLGRQKKWRKYGVCWQCDFTKTEEVRILRLYMYRLCISRKNVVEGDGVFLFGWEAYSGLVQLLICSSVQQLALAMIL